MHAHLKAIMLIYVSSCSHDFLWHYSWRGVLSCSFSCSRLYTTTANHPIAQTRLPVLALATVQLINFWCGYSDITWSRHLDVTWMLWWPGVASKVGTKLREFAPPRVVFGSLGRCWGGVCIPNHIVAMWNVVETLPIVLWLGTWVHQIAYFCQNWSRPLMTLGFHSEIFWSWCGECFENYIIACGDYAILFATCIADDEQHEY